MNHSGYWLMKSEPSTYGIDDLAREGTDHWDGIRNYQARNFMRDGMKVGDLAFFYHSNCLEPGIVGLMEVVREAYPDFTAWDPESPYHDPRSTPEAPRWLMVDVRHLETFRRTITLAELRRHPELADMRILQKGNRLSITPVTPDEWKFILTLAEHDRPTA